MPALHPKVLANNLVSQWKVVKGDLVQIVAGQEAGKQGVVKKVFRDKNRLIVEGINLVKRHMPKTKDAPGSIVTKEAAIHYSNVALVCPETNKPTRVEIRFLEDGTKVRWSKVGQVIIPKPEPKKRKFRPSNKAKDTASANVLEKTFKEQELIELKNRYLRQMELVHYNHLKQVYEQNQKKELKKVLDERRFEYQVFQRAKQLFTSNMSQQNNKNE